MKHLIAAIAFLAAAPATLAAAVGEVTFAAGDARVEGTTAKRHPLREGTAAV